MRHIITLLNQQYVLLFVIGSVVGGILCAFAMVELMNQIYEYHRPLGLLPFIASPIVVAITAFMSITPHIYRVAVANPVDALRSE